MAVTVSLVQRSSSACVWKECELRWSLPACGHTDGQRLKPVLLWPSTVGHRLPNITKSTRWWKEVSKILQFCTWRDKTMNSCFIQRDLSVRVRLGQQSYVSSSRAGRMWRTEWTSSRALCSLSCIRSHYLHQTFCIPRYKSSSWAGLFLLNIFCRKCCTLILSHCQI